MAPQIGESEESSIEPVTLSPVTATQKALPSTTTQKTVTETLISDSWTRGIESHFAQMADAFAQSIDNKNINEYRVRFEYNAAAASVSSKICPKLSDDQKCARQSSKNECGLPGTRDDCKDNSVCCFNGCENVCYHPRLTSPVKTPLPPVVTKSPTKCPRKTALPKSMCLDSRPNCWSSDTYDLDCPNSGLCCFDGCHNRCLLMSSPVNTPFNYSIQNQEVTEAYEEEEEEAVQEVDNIVDSLHPSINQREPTLVLHIFGPPKSKALVQFGNLPEKKSARIAAERRSSSSNYHSGGGNDNSLLIPTTSEAVTKSSAACPPHQRSNQQQCYVRRRHQCLSSSDCRPKSRCCFDGCVNSCVVAVEATGLVDPTNYRR